MGNKLTKKYADSLRERLAEAEYAAEYLNAVWEEDDQAAFLLALRDVAEAHGMAETSRQSNLNRESLYRMLSRQGNPSLKSLSALLKSVGIDLHFTTHTAHAAGS